MVVARDGFSGFDTPPTFGWAARMAAMDNFESEGDR
jgi:hypothetical protein